LLSCPCRATFSLLIVIRFYTEQIDMSLKQQLMI
jgi:hypothetical protein